MHLKLLILLAASALCSSSTNVNAYGRLLDDLFEDADYDPRVIPMEKPPKDTSDNSNALDLGLGISIVNAEFTGDPDSKSGGHDILTVNAWIKSRWTDYRLMWEPEQYDGLSVIRVSPETLWRPDLAVYNSVN